MVKRIILSVLLLLSAAHLWAQLPRSREFHDKYHLTEVVVFSRHNIRAPLSAPGSFISKVTPYTWHDFGVNTGELTMKGGVLETINGQFFHKWAVSENLFPENAEPEDEELYVLANSFQRTIATARYFSAGFMPMKTVTVHHESEPDHMDANFSPIPGRDITGAEWEQIKAEYKAAYSDEDIRKISETLRPAYDLLSEIIDMKNSEAYRSGSFTGFNDYNSTVVFRGEDEPRMSASLDEAASVVDALLLQYYEEPDSQKAAFGKKISIEDWRMLAGIIDTCMEIRFGSPFIQSYVSRRLREYIADALQKDGRKFTFICGHDVNIFNILRVLRTVKYETTDAVEHGSPIGSKIVFEKWTDAAGNHFVAVNHVYQTVDQLRNVTPLDLDTRPAIIPLQFEGLEPNADGLYPFDRMIQRLVGAS